MAYLEAGGLSVERDGGRLPEAVMESANYDRWSTYLRTVEATVGFLSSDDRSLLWSQIKTREVYIQALPPQTLYSTDCSHQLQQTCLEIPQLNLFTPNQHVRSQTFQHESRRCAL